MNVLLGFVLFYLVIAVNMLRNFLQIVDNFKPAKNVTQEFFQWRFLQPLQTLQQI